MEAGGLLSGSSARTARDRGASLAARLRRDWPPALKTAPEDDRRAPILAALMFIRSGAETSPRQLKIIGHLGPGTAEEAATLQSGLAAGERLPLLSLSAPTLARLSPERRSLVKRVVLSLMAANGKLNLFEAAAGLMLKKSLGLTFLPPAAAEPAAGYFDEIKKTQAGVGQVLSALAHTGGRGPAEAEAAFKAAWVHFNQWPPQAPAPRETLTIQSLLANLEYLAAGTDQIKRNLILAAVTSALHEPPATEPEYEFLWALAAALEVDLPMGG